MILLYGIQSIHNYSGANSIVFFFFFFGLRQGVSIILFTVIKLYEPFINVDFNSLLKIKDKFNCKSFKIVNSILGLGENCWGVTTSWPLPPHVCRHCIRSLYKILLKLKIMCNFFFPLLLHGVIYNSSYTFFVHVHEF
jgi:hypothetical protein